jgi:hypothetical protein
MLLAQFRRRPAFVQEAADDGSILVLSVAQIRASAVRRSVDDLRRAARVAYRTGKPHYTIVRGWHGTSNRVAKVTP